MGAEHSNIPFLPPNITFFLLESVCLGICWLPRITWIPIFSLLSLSSSQHGSLRGSQPSFISHLRIHCFPEDFVVKNRCDSIVLRILVQEVEIRIVIQHPSSLVYWLVRMPIANGLLSRVRILDNWCTVHPSVYPHYSGWSANGRLLKLEIKCENLDVRPAMCPGVMVSPAPQAQESEETEINAEAALIGAPPPLSLPPFSPSYLDYRLEIDVENENHLLNFSYFFYPRYRVCELNIWDNSFAPFLTFILSFLNCRLPEVGMRDNSLPQFLVFFPLDYLTVMSRIRFLSISLTVCLLYHTWIVVLLNLGGNGIHLPSFHIFFPLSLPEPSS